MAWYVDEYADQSLCVQERKGASLLRYPISHGRFASEEAAEKWLEKAEQNIEKGKDLYHENDIPRLD